MSTEVSDSGEVGEGVVAALTVLVEEEEEETATGVLVSIGVTGNSSKGFGPPLGRGSASKLAQNGSSFSSPFGLSSGGS